MKYLLDTDHISIYQQAQSAEHGALVSRMAQHSIEDFSFSIVSYHEQFLGIQTYISQARSVAKLVRGYEMLRQLHIDYSRFTMSSFETPEGILFDSMRSQRVRIGTMDLRIASIALSRNLILLTRNVSDFAQVPGLVTEDWTV